MLIESVDATFCCFRGVVINVILDPDDRFPSFVLLSKFTPCYAVVIPSVVTYV